MLLQNDIVIYLLHILHRKIYLCEKLPRDFLVEKSVLITHFDIIAKKNFCIKLCTYKEKEDSEFTASNHGLS